MRKSTFLLSLVTCLIVVFLSASIDAQTNKKEALKAAPASTAPVGAKAGTLMDLNSATVDQLVSKNILPQATYDKIKDLVIAKQSAAKAK